LAKSNLPPCWLRARLVKGSLRTRKYNTCVGMLFYAI
jgi:hypothetical protein